MPTLGKLNQNITSQISTEIFRHFFYNRKYFGRQIEEDGKIFYLRKRNKISAAILENMLFSSKSIMSYQQVLQKLKWICLDIDIAKSEIDEGFDFFQNEVLRADLYKVYTEAVKILNQYKIKFLSEFSGNRGIHIWIFFDEEVSKNIGYSIINQIDNELQRNIKDVTESILIDKYPKNGLAKNNTIGLGVKVPLSFHMKSKRYSYLFEDLSDIKNIENLSNEFLEQQINILKKIETNPVSDLLDKLNIKEETIEEIYEKKKLIIVENGISSHEIEEALSKSIIFKNLFEKPLMHWNEKDRVVLVASLIRITSLQNEKFGFNFLKDFFSKDAELYDEEITYEKLRNLKGLYPPNIKYLEQLYNVQCEYCRKNEISNVVDLLDKNLKFTKIELIKDDFTDIKDLAIAERNYLLQNDEVPLTFIEDDLTNISVDEIKNDIKRIYNRKFDYENVEFYKYLREETDIKTRVMYSLGARDRVISTFMVKKLTEYMYGDFSVNSYAYRLNHGKKQYVFQNWSKAWLEYVYCIEGIVNDESYDNYYLIKLDIRSFYDSINYTVLREILLKKIKTNINPIKETEIFPIIEYLIEISKKITGAEKGVPQGPAFARVIAELYLSEVDEKIELYLEDDFESYYRYVDDMFIVVRDERRANKIFDIIQQVLDTLKLSINKGNEKFLFGVVKDLKHSVITKSFEKYFVDGLEYIGANDELMNNAKRLLENMLLNEFNEIDLKQMPFYLTHLVDKDVFDSRKQEIGELILQSNQGRGSLFKHFYNNILFNETKINYEVNLLKGLQGLSRSNLITALIKNYEKYSHDFLKDIVKHYYLQDNLYDYEKIELIRLTLFSKIDTKDMPFENKDVSLMLKHIKYSDSFSVNEDLELHMLKELQYKGNLNPMSTLSDLDSFLEKNEEIKNLRSVVSTFETIISISIDSNITASNAQKLTNIVCFVTLYSEMNINGIAEMWKRVLDIDEKTFISMNDWYKYESHIDWANTTEGNLITIISQILNEVAILSDRPVSQREKEFVLYLLLLMLSPENHMGSSVDLEKIRKLIDEKDIQFLKWCMAEDTEFYPDLDDVARLNTYYNNRVVFIRNTELLIRTKADLKEFIQVENIITDKWLNGEEYINFVLNINKHEVLMNIIDKLKGKDLIYSIKKVYELFNLIDEEGVYNFFEKGTFVNTSEDIHFKYSKLDEKIVVDNKNIFDNKPREMKNKLLELLENEELIMFNKDIYSYNPAHFKSEFIPVSLKGDRVLEYISSLGKYLKEQLKGNEVDPIKIEKAKLVALKEIMKKGKRNLKEIDILHAYSSLCSHDLDRLIVFENEGKKIEDNDLGEMLNSLVNHIRFDVFEELNGVYSEISDARKTIDKYFVKSPQKIRKFERDYKDSSLLKINDEIKKIKDIRILYPFEHDELETLPTNEINNLGFRFGLYTDINANVVIAIPLSGLFSIKDKIDKINNKAIIQRISGDWHQYKSLDSFRDASSNIQKQNGINEIEATQKIYKFLSEFDGEYRQALLKLIAAYKVIDDKACKEFFDKLKRITNERKACLLPLKSSEDNNGLHVMVTTIGRSCGFDRQDIYLKKLEEDFNIINNSPSFEDKKTLVIITDIGLSGSQFKRTLSKYIDNGSKGLSKEYLQINSDRMKEYLKYIDEIIIFTVVYTDIFEKEVNKKLTEVYKGLGRNSPKIIFEGEKINKSESTFESKLTYKIRETIKEALSKPEFTGKNLYTKGKNKSIFSDFLRDIEKDMTSNILLARYKSMPKSHILPLTGSMGVFNYRKDFK